MPAAVFTTVSLSAVSVMLSMVIAAGIRIIVQSPGSQCPRCLISRPLNPGIELNPGISQRHLSAHSNTAADQSIRSGCLQETCQGSMSAPIGIDNLLTLDSSAFRII